ncbi:hypothetical protein [Pseudomonas aeruginosa]|uniref:hypothetical protein n=1 Tax=Pseudomonas aeruginosa TaxID=287 RepID=UPI0011B1C9B7|nr:hypothetical protein [Pseudomonas aeruginosa]
MTVRLVGTAVGCINYKGQFAALIYNLKFSDGSSLSVSMGEMVCAQLASLFQGYLVEVGGVSESPEAEREFKRNEGVMPRSMLENPSLDTVVSHVVSRILDGGLVLSLIFKNTGDVKTVVIRREDVPSFIGYTFNALQGVGVLDRVMRESAGIMTKPSIMVYDCKFNSGDIDYNDRRGYNIDEYRLLPYLYGVVIVDNSGAGRKVVAGFFLKSALTSNDPKLREHLADAAKQIVGSDYSVSKELSLLHTNVFVSDGEPLSIEEMQNFLAKLYLEHSVGGVA